MFNNPHNTSTEYNSRNSCSAMKDMTCVVAALDGSWGIGKNGGLPWKSLPGDMANFRKVTIGNKQNAVIMGRKTWDSIPTKFRPLKDRLNVVISHSPTTLQLPDGVLAFGSIDEAHEALLALESNIEEIFVIGGAQIYAAAMNHPSCTTILLTRVSELCVDCDTFMSSLEDWDCVNESEQLVDESLGAKYSFCRYIRNSMECK